MNPRQRHLLAYLCCCVAFVACSSIGYCGDDATTERPRRSRAPEVVEFEPQIETRSVGDGLYSSQPKAQHQESVSVEKPKPPAEPERPRAVDRAPQAESGNRWPQISTSIDSDFEFGMVIVALIVGLVAALIKLRSRQRKAQDDAGKGEIPANLS